MNKELKDGYYWYITERGMPHSIIDVVDGEVYLTGGREDGEGKFSDICDGSGKGRLKNMVNAVWKGKFIPIEPPDLEPKPDLYNWIEEQKAKEPPNPNKWSEWRGAFGEEFLRTIYLNCAIIHERRKEEE